MADDFNDFLIDSQLHIKTTGRNDKHSDTHRYPYEPTSYTVLDRIIESEYISKDDVLLDYGSGMGRVAIYLHSRLGCRALGVELIKEFYKISLDNAKSNKCMDSVTFINGMAERYEVPDDVTACFFFNPFDIGIMRGVMNRIIDWIDIMI